MGLWKKPAERDPSLMGPSTLRFLGVERDISVCGWDPASIEKLWRYNLHYFDDLNARGARQRLDLQRALVTKWILDNRPTVGTGWEPYPVSLRIVNWVKWLLGGIAPEPAWLDSLASQARWLRRRLETHLLGNHLFANCKALIFAGLFFEGSEAEDWLRHGTKVVERELEEQVLSDGGHFERSSMYHALFLEDSLDLLNLIDAFGPHVEEVQQLVPALHKRAVNMLRWLHLMVHPSGQLALFNDCADGIAPSLPELDDYAGRLGIRDETSRLSDGIFNLAHSGYVRVVRGPMTALLDVAPIGPDYLPAHAHADTLSFELSLGATRVIANGGTSLYEIGPRRSYERSTAAHNTVDVAGYDSSEVWAGFRVGRRAHPTDLVLGEWDVACSHDGYRFLDGRPVHRRRWSFLENGVTVEDHVSPPKDAHARYHLADGLTLEASGTHRWKISRGASGVAEVTVQIGRATIERVAQAQRFGVVKEVDSLVIALSNGRASTSWTWSEHAHTVPDR